MMRKIKKFIVKKQAALIIVLVTSVVGTFLLIFTHAATPPTVTPAAAGNGQAALSLQSSSSSAKVGSTLPITVYEDSGTDKVQAMNIGVVYNTNLLSITSADVSGAGSPMEVIKKSVVVSGGVVTFASYANPNTGDGFITGKQLVVTLNFKVLAAGTATISFQDSASAGASVVSPYQSSSNAWDHGTTGGSFTLTTASTGGGGTSTPPAASPGGFTTTPPASSGNSGNSTSTTKSTSQAGSNQAASVPTEFTTPSVNGQINLAVAVTDQNDKPAIGVTVTLGSKTAKTDNSGVAYFLNIEAGKYEVKVAGGVLGTATKSITVSSSQTQRVSVKLKKGINYVLYAAIAAAILLLLLFITLARRWFQKRAGESHHFPNKVVVGGSAQNSPDSLDEEIAPVLVTPKLVDEEPSLSKAAETEPEKKPSVRPTDTLDEIEKKVGVDKGAASKPEASVKTGPQIITPEKRTT